MGRGSAGGYGGDLVKRVAEITPQGTDSYSGFQGFVGPSTTPFRQAFAVQPRNTSMPTLAVQPQVTPMPTFTEVRPQPDIVQPPQPQPQLTHAVYPTSGPQPQPQPISPFETYRNFMGQTGRGYSDNFNRDFYTGFNRPPPMDMTGLVRRQPVQPFRPAQPEFDANTTQAEFDRARGITPAAQQNQMMQPQFMGGKGSRFGGFNPYAGGFSPMGGKGGGYNPFGGYGGPEYGNRPFYGQEYGPSPGLGGLTALMQGRGFYNEGGEVK